jgi:hypothetical protein
METSININNLSNSEIELIAKVREEQLQLEQTRRDELNKKRNDLIHTIKKEVDQANKQVEAATEYFNELNKLNPDFYELILNERKIQKNLYDIYFGSGVIETLEETVNVATIKVLNKDYKQEINIELHITYSSRWDVRGTNNGYKMTIKDENYNTKYYKNVKTLNEKITSKLDSINNARLSKEKQLDALENAVYELNMQYGNQAEITTSKGYKRYGTKYSDYSEYDIIIVKFNNGIKATFRVYSDGSLGKESVEYPCSANELLEKLSQISF